MMNPPPDASREGYERARAALERFQMLREDWDGEGAPRISEWSIRRAKTVVVELQSSSVPAPQVAAMPDGGVALSWKRVTRHGLLEIEARLVDEGDELMIGHAHVPGFEVHDYGHSPEKIADTVREWFFKDA